MSEFLNNHGHYDLRYPFERYLDTNGDGTGNNNAVGDYSGAPTPFYAAPAAGETWVIQKMIIHVGDHGAFDYDGYGALGATPLTNGITITVHRLGAQVLELTGGVPILGNADLSHLNTDYALNSYVSSFQVSNVSFNVESFGTPLFMYGDLGDQIRVNLHDNFTGLNDHHFILYGRK